MSFLFNVPDSLKKNAPGNTGKIAQNRAFQRPTTNYADLDDPNGGGAPPAPERRQRLSNITQDRSKFSLRRAPDGSILPKPTMPPRTVGKPSGAARPPARGTLTRAGLIPAGARNPYTLKRTGLGRPSVPERHPSPAPGVGGTLSAEEGEEEEDMPQRSSRLTMAARNEPSKFAGIPSLFAITVDGGGSKTDGGPRSLFDKGRTPSPSGMTRRREASPQPLASRAVPAAAAAPSAPPEGRGGASARTLTAHDLTGMRNVADIARALRRLVGRACPADFDRYQLLDERDKLLCKLREIKPSFFSKSGSCKDMCPEKERYVRVVQMRVADFEVDMLGDMEPRRMVKEYSRSAADQEEPLEHEMRPAAVLERTMEYLLTDIVDGTIEASPDSSKWYDFMWNRTRAIRKELTQQMILDESAVRLIECCTRMHMYAGHSLGRLPREEFDPAMNEENLSKCLQSLRHLYEDLAKKEIFVESEAEFRAYDVMLHLTDSNILRQVLSYRRSVRESPAVRLALRLFSAIQSNNYTRFFRLVREQATYAQCCVLYRYFGKMRLHAFSTMTTAYNKGGTLPMALIAKVLAFESVEQAIEVAAQYGLSYTQDAAGAPALLPDNRDFNASAGESAGAVPAGWIEEKRAGRKLSEIFRGGPSRLSGSLEGTTPPVDSFDPVTGTYSYDPVLNGYLTRLGSAAPDDPIAPSNLARAQQKRAEIVVERPAAAALAAPAATISSKPAFGGLTTFGKAAPAATIAAAASPTGGFSFGKATSGASFGSGVPTFGTGAAPSFGGFGIKPAGSGFSFAPSSTTATSEELEDKKPMFSIKHESDTVPKPEPKQKVVSEAQVEQTAERLLTRVVDDATRTVVRDVVAEEAETKRREEEERKEKERARKEQQEREARQAMERAAAAAAAAKSAEKRRRSEQARLLSCSDHLFKRVLWPALVKEVVDVATKGIVQEAVREEHQRIDDGIARYKARMHDLWLRQFTERWREYAKWKKEERQRVRQVLAAIVSRNPFEGIGGASLKRRLSSPDPDVWQDGRKLMRTPYGKMDPLTALSVIGFVERRRTKLSACVARHWRQWAERRARRRMEHTWPLNRACVLPRVRPPTPTPTNGEQQKENYGRHDQHTSLPLVEKVKEKRHKSRRSIGLYPFLSADDSFLDGRATPLGGATPVVEQRGEERENAVGRRRKLRASDIFNSTAVADTTAVPTIGFATFVGRPEEETAVEDADVEYASALMDQTAWAVGQGARERWRRKEAMGADGWRRREEWESRPLASAGEAAMPSWHGLFEALNAEPEASSARGHAERASLRALETPEPLNRTGMAIDCAASETTMRPAEQPWEREEREEKERIAARNADIDAQLEESRRLREAAAADRARQDAMLARMGY